jgi:hypothetical protein
MKATMSIGGEISAADLEQIIAVLIEHQADCFEISSDEDDSASFGFEMPREAADNDIEAARFWRQHLTEFASNNLRFTLLASVEDAAGFYKIVLDLPASVSYRLWNRKFGVLYVRPPNETEDRITLDYFHENPAIIIGVDAAALNAEALLAQAQETLRLFHHKPPLKILP